MRQRAETALTVLVWLACAALVVAFWAGVIYGIDRAAGAGPPPCTAGVGAASYPGNVEGTIRLLPEGCAP